jgi:hypothetical protein
MRIVLAALLGLVAATSAQAGDLGVPQGYYGAAPPPAYVQGPPPVYLQEPPPVVGYGRPRAYDYAPPPPYPARGVIAAPQGPAYVVPGPVYQPGDEYAEAPAVVDGTRYYRQCWFEFGYRRCALRHKAFFW